MKRADVVLLLTDHSAFPYAMIAEKARVIVDTPGAFKNVPHDREKTMMLGSGDFLPGAHHPDSAPNGRLRIIGGCRSPEMERGGWNF